MSGAALYLSLDELVAVLGEALAMRLVAAHGGTRIYVGRRWRAGNKVVAAIGRDGAEKLAASIETGHGGMWVDLPCGPAGAAAELRRRLLDAAGRRDLSEAEIARRLRVHGRTVRRARARLREDDGPQGRLF